jgi:hypothetical protein
MITVRLDADIPDSRQITLKLPPEVPAGPAEVFLVIESAEKAARSAHAPSPASVLQEKFERERAAFRRLLPGLLDTHRGLYVAVHDGEAVESGPDQIDVAKRAYAKFGNVPIYVGLVTDQPQPVVRIPHVKVVDRR